MTNAKQHPLNFDSLQKGDMVGREQLERIYRPLDEQELRVCMMKLGAQIEAERPDLLVRYKGYSIHIMHDEEADVVTFKRVGRATKSIVRNSRRRARINRDNFTAEQLRVAEHRDRVVTALAIFTHKQLMKSQRDELLLKMYENEDDEDQT